MFFTIYITHEYEQLILEQLTPDDGRLGPKHVVKENEMTKQK
jgi:hypothetical protein